MCLLKTYFSKCFHLFIQIGHLKGRLHFPKDSSTQNFIYCFLDPCKSVSTACRKAIPRFLYVTIEKLHLKGRHLAIFWEVLLIPILFMSGFSRQVWSLKRSSVPLLLWKRGIRNLRWDLRKGYKDLGCSNVSQERVLFNHSALQLFQGQSCV